MVVMTGLMVAIDTIDDSFGTTAGAIYELCLRYQWGIDKLQYDVISRLRVPLFMLTTRSSSFSDHGKLPSTCATISVSTASSAMTIAEKHKNKSVKILMANFIMIE